MESTSTTATAYSIGQTVKRVQPGDYTDGRIGEVVEINAETQRARVLWAIDHDYNGNAYTMSKPIRTWVKFSALVPASAQDTESAA